MAATNFDHVLARTLVYEGGKVDDKRDPGGRTAYGITQRTFSNWLKAMGRAVRDVYTITKDEIRAIYKKLYWDAIHGDDLPAGIDMVMFDAAVNSGVAQAVKWTQRALGTDYRGMVDGIMGLGTLNAVRSVKDDDRLVAGIVSRRLATLKTLRTWKTYGKGWSARCANVMKIGTAWATGSIGPDPVHVADLGGHMKANVADVRQPLLSVPKSVSVAGAGGFGELMSNLANTFDPVKEYVPYIAGACAVLLAVGGGLTLLAHFHKDNTLKAQDAISEVDVDTDADANAQPVAVNDNEPLAGILKEAA